MVGHRDAARAARIAVAAWAVAAAMLSASPVAGARLRAQAAAPPYRVQQLSTNNGLPQNTVSGIAQTPDGFLWVATFDGLARFDGVAFTTFDRGTTPAMRRTQFLSLTVDGAGVLWAGTDAGILRLKDGVFEWRDPAPTEESRRHPADPHYQPGFVEPPAPHWIVRHDSLVHAGAGPDSAAAIVADPRAHHGVRDFAAARDPFQVAGVDAAGDVWLAGRSLLVRYRHGAFTSWSGGELLGDGNVRSAFVDRDGTLWVGTNEIGLFRVTPPIVTSYSVPEGLLAPVVYPVAEDGDGRIWIGTRSAISRWERGRFTGWMFVHGGPLGYALRPATRADAFGTTGVAVRSMFAGRDRTLWVCVDHAVLAVRDDRVVRVIPVAGDAPDVVHVDRSGDIWIASRDLERIHGDSVVRYGPTAGVPRSVTHVIHEDSAGRLWVGTHDGLLRRDGERFVVVGRGTGLDGAIVRSLYEAPDGAIWAGTFDAGLYRIRHDSVAGVTSRDGLFTNGVFQMIADDRGLVWMSGNRGIFRVSLRQLNDAADGRTRAVVSVPYGTRDGMRSTEANGGRPPAGVRARDGRIWFPTTDGVAVVDPSLVRIGERPPPVAIDRVTVDGLPRAPERGGVRLAPGEANLAVQFSAPTSINPGQIRFRYKLATGDAPWTDAGTAREVHFSDLRPGRYTFSVTAASSEGAWGATATELQVTVAPHFWQTAWFAVLLVAGLGGGGAAGYKARVRALKERQRHLQALVDERTRDLRVANDRLAQLAVEDPLTGLANRRRLDAFLAAEWQRAERSKASVAVIAIDVDYFKRFNDTYGHAAGDDCLRRVAQVLASCVRAGTDLAARAGGEEFILVLTGSGADGARTVAGKVRAGVEALGIPHDASDAARVVTVSLGVAAGTPDGGATVRTLLADADRALYEAKRAGRNRAC